MLLNELQISGEKRIAKINRVLKESCGFTLNSNIDATKLRDLQSQVNKDLYKLKLNQATALDSAYTEKLLVREGLAIIEKRLNEDAPSKTAFEKVLSWLADFVRNACEVGDLYEEAIKEAMKHYRSSKYRFDDNEVLNALRMRTAYCDEMLDECGVMPVVEEPKSLAIDVEDMGKWQSKTPRSRPRSFEPATNICPDCVGRTGSGLPDPDCPRCDGMGEIFESVKIKEDQEHEIWLVHIPANIYDGKYYDFRTVPVKVSKSVGSEQDAIDYVNNNKEEVLANIDKKRMNYGGRSIRYVRKPAEKNVYFKDSYYVKPSKVWTATSGPGPKGILGMEQAMVSEDSGHSITDIIGQDGLAQLRADLEQTGRLNDAAEYRDQLFNYYLDSGEMPYGTAKARTGDPDQWILDRIEQDYGAEVSGVGESWDRHDRYADRDWVKSMKADQDRATRKLGGDELTLRSDDRRSGSNDYFSYRAKKAKKVTEAPTAGKWFMYGDEEMVRVSASMPVSVIQDYVDALIEFNDDAAEAIEAKLGKKLSGAAVRVFAYSLGVDTKVAKAALQAGKPFAVGESEYVAGFGPTKDAAKKEYLKVASDEPGDEDFEESRKTNMKEGYVKQLRRLLEAEVDQAESLIAAKSFSQELQDMVEKLGRLVNEDLPAVAEQMRDAYGADVATGFEDAVGSTLSNVMDTLKSSKQELDNSVSSIADGGMPSATTDMDDFGADDMDVDADADLDADLDIDLDMEPGDDLGGADAAAGPEDEPLGRAKKESIQRMRNKIVEMQEKLARVKRK